MMKSITHILQIINNNESFPSISFQLIYTGSSLTLKPEIKEVYNEYHKLLFMIENIAQDLIPLEKSAGLETDQEFIKITLPLWFIQESHDKLEKLINNLFKPVQNHIIHIANQFNISSKHSTEKEISSLLLGEPNFSIYKDHIQKYNSYFINTIMMRDHVNYNVGTLNQITAKKELKKHALDIKTKLMTRLITYHFEFNQSICSEFENIKAKALNIPRDAKLLIELSKYMANVSKVTINELEEKIEKSIEMLSSLLDVAPLTGEHMELNKTTINWLTLIQPIFHQNNTLSEAMKSELEDDLQKSINTVNTEVDKIFPELIILDDMDDIKRINEYIDHFVDLIKKLNRINVQVATINSEEQLLKFPETLFPTVTELQEIIVPFRKLLKIIHQWQRDQAMWLDGPYEYLDATIIEKRALDYHQEITEMYKNFKAKIKADVAANKPFRFSGIADDPHPLQQPSPLKLCWQALNEINNLKIYLPLAICMCNPALLKRHWEEMSLIAGFDLLPNAAFLKALEKVCSERNLNLNETFKSKAQQILELINTRRAILIMGDALVGKTEMLHSVRNSLSLLKKEKINIGSNIQLETITPNVLDCSQLFGFYNDSKNWIDGFGTKIIRQFSTDDSCDKQWLVFDGSLSAEWIEHLYTVLDNNSLLTLISGEQISIPNSISLFFETDNIHETSPAVISRCGMIYVDLHNLTWKSFVISYIEKQQFFQSNKETIQSLFEWAINSSLEFLKRNSVNSLGELQMVKSIINLFDMHLMEIAQSNLEEKLVNTWTQIILILSIAWGICGNLESDKQSRFNLFSTSLWTGTNEEYPKLKEFKEFNISLPSEGFIQDYFYDFKTNKWKNWKDSLKDQQIPEYNYPYDSCIPTTTSLKFDNLARKHIKFQKPFIVIGNSGTGKTTIIKDFLERKLSSEKYISHILNIYSLLDTKKTQKLMLLKLDKIKKWIYKPAGDKHCVNFIDDLNLDEKSSEIKFVLELTRQYLSTGHWYHNTEIKSLMFDKTLFLYAITKRYRTIDLCPRFARYFDIYTIESLDSENLYRIFSTTLLNKWTNNQLNADVSGSVTGMVNGTISLYNFVIKAFEPTPSKMQYRFLISDVARVINGCSLIQKESIESKATFIRLWAHENWRVFSDRMLEDNDKQILFEAIVECVKKNFKDSFESVFDHLPKSEDGQITKGSFDSLYFANFLDFEKSTKRYEEVNSHETLRTKIMQYLSEYNDKNEKRIHMAISRYVLENFVKISRSLAVPAGENVILVAPEGSGKKSTTKLAAFAQRQTFFEASAESSYDSRVWREDLKRVLMQCGTEEEDAVFLIVEESLNQLYLRDVSSLSSTGEVQGLFSYEEKNEIIQKTRLMAQNGKRNAEFDSFTVLRYFAHRCRNKSHLVLCFCPTSNSLKIYLHTYPALLKNFLINCYDYWPTGSLTQVAAHYVERSKISEPEIKSLVSACVGLHEMANNFFSRSKKKNLQSSSQSCFLHMCGLYVDLVGRKGEEILDSIRKYLAGLEKLESAGRRVVEMRETLGVLKPRLESSARRAMETMQEIEAENASVERYKTQVKLDEEIANRKTEIAGRLRGECEAELAFAIPILEDAIQALNTLRPMDVTLCKAMKNPPDTVKLVMAAVCVMLEVPPDRIIDPADGKKMLDYWGPSKRILGDMNFLPILKDYDKDNIPTTAIQSIKKTFMTDKNFLPSIVAKASSAAEGLCKWVRAMVAYDEIAKAVAPKKEKLAAAQIECDQAESFLGEKRKALASLTAKLTILKDSLEETERKKVALESEIDLCTRKLRKAERLIDSLGNEKERWQECARNVQESYDNLCGNLLLSSGTIAYLASCTLEDRRIVVKSWKDLLENLKIPVSGVYSLVGTLYDERETILWRLSGFLAENATVVKLSLLRCLIVDPQGQASEWIGRIEEGNGLRVGTLNDDDSMGIIRRGMEQGTPVLLESIDDNLSVNLVTILKKLVHKIEDNWYLDVADETLKNKQDFRLYFTSKLAKQFYTSDKFHGLTIVDFTISRKVLENKLLDIAFSKENPRMQEKFENISLRDLESKKSIQEQEDRILNILSQSSGNILEDENAIDMMKAFKNTLMDIVDQEEAERDVLININAKRQVYAEFVEYCSDLYDTLTSLSYLNRMYQFALSWFLNIYSKAIEESKISVKTEKRLKFLKDSITKNLHLSVCNWLYEEHKFLYTFIFQTKILLHNNEATKSEIETFIHGPNKNYVKIVKPVPKWIPEDSWKEICWIDENLPGFQNIANDLQKNDEWEVFFQPETFLPKSMPFAWKNKLTSFQKLILIKILRPDEIYVEITRLMEKDDLLSLAFDHSSQLKISLAFEESHCVNPILILLPSIFNPISLVASFAKRMKCSCTFSSLSLGEGLDATALNLIENARIEGAWVFLENSHLNIPLMRKIERIFDDINLHNTPANFRLWISSCSSQSFPTSLLQKSTKLVYDESLRFKENLLQIYQTEFVRKSYFLKDCPGKEKLFSRLLYNLCFFHTLVKERNNFGTSGWHVPYNFDLSDFQISARQLKSFINERGHWPLDTYLYTIGDCNYANKIFDDFDKNCLKALLRDIYSTNDSIFKNHSNFAAPRRLEYRDMIAHIENLPIYLPPEIFGVHRNTIIGKNLSISSRFFESLSSLHGDSRDSLFDDDDIRPTVLSMINEMENNLPNIISEEKVFKDEEQFDSMLHQEMEFNNSIVQCVRDTFTDVRLALNGTKIPTAEIEEFCVEIFQNLVPKSWKRKYHVRAENLGAFVVDISEHFNEIQKLIKREVPFIVNFNRIHFPRVFLTGCLLSYCKKYNIIPDNKIRFKFYVTSAIDPINLTNTCENMYFINGLHLFGARWDLEEFLLINNAPNKFSQKMPLISFTFTSEQCDLKQEEYYECPLYHSICNEGEINSNFITTIPLKTNLSQTRLSKLRVLLFCSHTD
ncbi:dynein axonemal heavy chain 7-like [Prorops nasuta]|uniref:dynein axonemal heavy chain 7-like n=1 Tax=Prorops nasuta TaxID=863751 RepID=UPI0034CE7710